MKGIVAGALVMGIISAFGQSLTGTWQVVKSGNCMGDEFSDTTETEDELLESMASKSTTTPKTIRFNADNSGEENWRTIGKRKASSREKFLYRYSDGSIYFLDKKSRIITDTFIVEELTYSTLIMFNKSRSCERLELTRIY